MWLFPVVAVVCVSVRLVHGSTRTVYKNECHCPGHSAWNDELFQKMQSFKSKERGCDVRRIPRKYRASKIFSLCNRLTLEEGITGCPLFALVIAWEGFKAGPIGSG